MAYIGTTLFRLDAALVNSGLLVSAQSLAETTHVENVLRAAEIIAAPVLLLVAYVGTLVIGLMTSGPVERTRTAARIHCRCIARSSEHP